MTDLDELRKKAEAATKGPWYVFVFITGYPREWMARLI